MKCFVLIIFLLTIFETNAQEDPKAIFQNYFQLIKKKERKELIKSLKYTETFNKFYDDKYNEYVDKVHVYRKGDSLFRIDRFLRKDKQSFYYNFGTLFYKKYLTKYEEIYPKNQIYKWITNIIYEKDEIENVLRMNFKLDSSMLFYDSLIYIENKFYHRLIAINDTSEIVEHFHFDKETGLLRIYEQFENGISFFKCDIISYVQIDGILFPKIFLEYVDNEKRHEIVIENIKLNTKIDDRFFHPEPE